mmetsp:Transcript_21422/g.62404  ORF Transcript_21422/g.62404 Transcript_21422/m.62404 type:complete len:244 (-) Transcript_21422:189-920(-)
MAWSGVTSVVLGSGFDIILEGVISFSVAAFSSGVEGVAPPFPGNALTARGAERGRDSATGFTGERRPDEFLRLIEGLLMDVEAFGLSFAAAVGPTSSASSFSLLCDLFRMRKDPGRCLDTELFLASSATMLEFEFFLARKLGRFTGADADRSALSSLEFRDDFRRRRPAVRSRNGDTLDFELVAALDASSAAPRGDARCRTGGLAFIFRLPAVLTSCEYDMASTLAHFPGKTAAHTSSAAPPV